MSVRLAATNVRLARQTEYVPADRDVPPTRYQRWLVRRKSAYRAVAATVAGAAVVYAIWATLQYGLGYWWFIAAGLLFQVWLAWRVSGGATKCVADYDRTHPMSDSTPRA